MDNVFFFDAGTSEPVKSALIRAYADKTRVRVWYGEQETGKAWPEEFDVTGYIGRSTGIKPIALLVHSNRSTGGPGLLTACIVRIDATDGRTLYQHDRFNAGLWTITDQPAGEYAAAVSHDGELWARCKTRAQAVRLADFMAGKRYAK